MSLRTAMLNWPAILSAKHERTAGERKSQLEGILRGAAVRGQSDAERRALVHFALDGDVAVMRLDDTASDGEAETGTVLLCGEERFEEAVHVLGRDADASVSNGHAHLWATAGIGARRFAGGRRGDNVRRNRERTVRSH